MKLQKLVLLWLTLVVPSALFTPNVTPEVAQAQSAAGGQTAAPTPTWVAPTAIAAGVIAVGLVVAHQEDDNRTPTRPRY